ncbi:MAG TPA: hypothetical protein PKD70_13255 [Saprospiraceae bacterium]|nr:hypothetical protein [Saprospiraceae bacterium]HMP14840.1 hypothetical protein [Saprospiraceae bacterium]
MMENLFILLANGSLRSQGDVEKREYVTKYLLLVQMDEYEA